jgi:hypothetical protein
MSTVGGSFPAAISTLAVSRAPRTSLTTSDAVYAPGLAKVNAGLGSVSFPMTVPFAREIVHS